MLASVLALATPLAFRRRFCWMGARLQHVWRDDTAASSVEYAAVAGLGALGAVSVSRTAGHELAHTFDAIAAVLRSVSP